VASEHCAAGVWAAWRPQRDRKRLILKYAAPICVLKT
jgi:hypothetical protein